MKELLAKLPRLPIAIGLLALALYLPGFWWGVPYPTAPDLTHSWGVDSPMPLGPLADVYSSIDPQPDRNLGYPLMHSFLVDAAYTPYLGYLWLGGRFTRPSATYPYGLRDPVDELRVMTLIANFLSVLMGAGIAVAAYDAGQVLWDRRTGFLSALFAMLLYPMFYYSRTGNVDVATLFFTALALDVYARCLAGGFTVRRAVWMGIFVGFALGTKETSFASFLALPFVLLLLCWRSVAGKGNGGSWAFWKPPLVALASCCLAFGLGSGLLVGPARYIAHVEFARARLHFLAANHVAYLRSYPFTLEGNWELARLIAHYLVNSMTLAGLLLACLGVLWALWNEALNSAFALPAFTYAAVLFWSARTAELRYLMPAAFTLSFFAARAVVLAWTSRLRVLRYGFALVAVGVVLLSLLRGVDLTYAMVKDSRYAAGKWLEPRTRPGTRVDTFGPPSDLPPLNAGVSISHPIQFMGVYRPRLDATGVKEIVVGWRERKPDFIVILPDYTSSAGAPYSRSCPLAVYRGLLGETLGYRLEASFQTPDLLPWVRRPALDYPSVNPPIQIFARVDNSDFWAKQKAVGPGDEAARQGGRR